MYVRILPGVNVKKHWKVLKLVPNMVRSLEVSMPRYHWGDDEIIARRAKRTLFWVLRNCTGLESLATVPAAEVYAEWLYVKLESPSTQLLDITIIDKAFERVDLLSRGEKAGWARLKKITVKDAFLLYGFDGCEHSLQSIHLLETQ